MIQIGVISCYCDKKHHCIDKNQRKKTKDTIVPKRKRIHYVYWLRLLKKKMAGSSMCNIILA